MKIKVNPLIIALLPLVVGLIVGYLVTPKRDKAYESELQQQLEDKEKETEKWSKRFDSLAMRHDITLFDIDLMKDTLRNIRYERNYYMKKYENIKRTPVRIAGQSQLDSLLRARYPQ